MEASETLVAITGMLVTFGLPVAIVAIILFYKHRKQRMTHETIARLAEKGLPIPPQLFEPPPDRSRAGLKSGLVLLALGLGLSIFFLLEGGEWSIGLIPGLMGLALLVSWKIEQRRDEPGSPRH